MSYQEFIMDILNLQKIIIRDLQEKKIPFSKRKIIEFTRKILKYKGYQDFGLSIIFVDEDFIKKLNLKYLKKRSPTDILTFPLGENPENFLGDIVISIDSAIKNSSIFKTTLKSEILLYLTHGVLHLLGYSDNTERKRKIMESEQKRILALLKHEEGL
jgi:probable rRNA maturation factor